MCARPDDRPPWAPGWASAADIALLAEAEPNCVVCAKTEKLIKWLVYGVTTCGRHAFAEREGDNDKDDDKNADTDHESE
jgi:hypothetical protein